jgi:hypothetical protein
MMKKILVSFACVLSFAFQSQAECVYEKQLHGDEFPVGIMLTWSTSFEENTSSFMIEKSENGVNYINIGTAQSAGNSKKLRDYHFLDPMANTPTVYYRLKQIDVDGSFNYTNVLKVNKKMTNNFMIARMTSPNTSKDFTATVDVFKDGDMKYEIRDLANNTLFAATMPVQNGLNDITISVADLAPNTYKFFLKMEKEEESVVLQKVIDEVEKAKLPVASGQNMNNGKQ